ncbi:MAG: hypothetical protein ACI9LE_001118, partial [Paraglaciecola sp.]
KVMNKYARNSQYIVTTKEFRRRTNLFFTTTSRAIAGSLGSTIQQFNNSNLHLEDV